MSRLNRVSGGYRCLVSAFLVLVVLPLSPAFGQASSTPLPLPRQDWSVKAFATSGTDIVTHVIDGDVTTRWTSGKSQAAGQTLDIDLGSTQLFSGLTMDSGTSAGDYARGFDIRASDDGVTWKAPFVTGAGASQKVGVTFALQTSQYVRITLTKTATNWWSIHELTMTGLLSDFVPVPLSRSSWVASASVTCQTDIPAHVLDGSISTRWSTGIPQAKGQTFQIDMKTPQMFDRLTMDSGTSTGDYPRGFEIAVSANGTIWSSPVATGVGTSQITSISFPFQTARYVRISATKSASNWWSIHELNVSGLPAALVAAKAADVEAVPGYNPGSYGCDPGLVLGAAATDAQGTYYQSVGYAPANGTAAPGPSCRGGMRFCDAQENPIASPTEVTLNAAASATGQCPAIAAGDDASCGVDPATVGAACNSAADCGAGQVCSLVCDSASCLQPTKKCGRLYMSCGGIPAETSFCDPVEYRICADPQATGQVTIAQLDQQIPTQSALSASIQIGPNETLAVAPFDPLPPGTCNFEDTAIATDKEQLSMPDSNLGNTQWGVFLEPFAEQRFGLNKKENWWDDSVEVGGSAGVRAGAYVLGEKLTAVSGTIDVALSDCNQSVGATLKVFGDAVATIDTLNGGTLGFGKLTRQEDKMETPQSLDVDCTSKFQDRNDKAGDLRTAMFSARNVKNIYLDKGVTTDLCNRTNTDLATSFNCSDKNLGNNIDVPNAWIDEYTKAANNFKTAQTSFSLARGNLSFSLQKAFLSLGGKPYRIEGAETFIPVGPVTVTLAIEAYGFIFLNGGMQIGFAYEGGLLQGLQDLTPYGGILGTPADVSVAVGPFFTPGLGLNVAAFAGAGIPGVSIGIEGIVDLLRLSLPMDARIGASRVAVADTRNVQSSAYPGPPIAGVTQTTVKKWTFGGAFGIRAQLDALDGELDAAVRVRVLFAHKTFRKLLFRWKGLLDIDKVIVGGQFGAPLQHKEDLGVYASRIAYTGVEPVTGTDVPANPDPTARFFGTLTGEPCSVIIP